MAATDPSAIGGTERRTDGRQSSFTVFVVSAGVLGFEISLMRLLLVASWHHFAFLVISIALLGFGASGTALSLARPWLLPRAGNALSVLSAATALSMIVCIGLAQNLPVDARLLPSLLWRQLGSWLLYWILLGIPFFLGASVIGLALMAARQNVGRIYALNLIGSAVGAAGATAVMYVVPPAWLAPLWALVTLLALLPVEGRKIGKRIAWLTILLAVSGGYLRLDRPRVRLDPYKYGAYVRQLAEQGQALRAAAALSPRAVVEAHRGEAFHDLPFLTAGGVPPDVAVLLCDGHFCGSVLDVQKASDAAVMDHTVTAFAYDLAPPQPRVLLLGETGGPNVWLALRNRARKVQPVQPDANILQILRGPLREHGGGVMAAENVDPYVALPRHYVEHVAGTFDLVQLVSLESAAAGAHGLGGLAEDHLMTVEGVAACLNRLGETGLLSVTRGIQTPPRDNLKIMMTFAEALRRQGVESPRGHFVIVRDFLAVSTIVRRKPFTADDAARIREHISRRNLTPVWFPGIREDELNQPDALSGPPDAPGDWYHHAAGMIFSGRGEELKRDWPFYIAPPTDDRPFFLDFCKLSTLGRLKQTFGNLWLTRAELAFPLVLGAVVVIGVAAIVLIVLPGIVVTRGVATRVPWATVAYFGAIGLAFLFLEILTLSRLTLWIGDPVSAAAVTISGFLFMSGLGSLTVQRRGVSVQRQFRWIVAILVLFTLSDLYLLESLAPLMGGLSFPLRCIAAVAVFAPTAFLMGFPMPTGLRRLDEKAPQLVPWAWGINGFASVLSAPAATAIAMAAGYTAVGILAAALYCVPIVLLSALGGHEGTAAE